MHPGTCENPAACDAMEGGASPVASLADILKAVHREIADMGQLACGLQVALSPLGQEGRAVEALQDLDFITQRLQGVATFLAALAPTLPSSWISDAITAARAVTLSDLARRLGRPGHKAQESEDVEAGAFELFEADED